MVRWLSIPALVAVLFLAASTPDPGGPRADPEVAVFVTHEATGAQRAAIEARLRSVPGVTSVTPIDQAAEFATMRAAAANDPAAIAGLTPATLPAGFHFRMTNRRVFDSAGKSSLPHDLELVPGVDLVAAPGWPRQVSLTECLGRTGIFAGLPGIEEIQVFLDDGASAADRAAIEARLRALPGASQVTFRDRDQALAEFRQQFADIPGAVDKARTAGLPESYRVTTDAAAQAHDDGTDVALCRMPGVAHVLMPPG